jgi:hypothetical protein
MLQPPLSPHAADGALARVEKYVDLLVTVAYIDGLYHPRERAFIQRHLDNAGLLTSTPPAVLAATYARLEAEVAKLSAEVMSSGDNAYLPTRLKVRALELFGSFSPGDQATALELVRALMHVDGMISQSEHLLHDELMAYFTAPVPPAAALPTAAAAPMRIEPARPKPLHAVDHALLAPLEQTYSPHPVELHAQLARDYQLVEHAMAQWQRQRGLGHGRLAGVTDIAQLPVGARFLDGFVYVQRPAHPIELIVLGDLHGCYGCLKAALLQSDFINRAWAHQWDPARYPDVKLVLLGDYIDRGRFSFDGVLRAVLQLFVAMPEQVIVLRGNHEYFLATDRVVWSGVHPAEALASITPHVPFELLDAYRRLFEQMPTSFLCDRTLFVHGGVPRDDSFAARYHDLASLNDGELRFQMLWSDPSDTEHVPVELQRQDARFSFGRRQFRAFMERLGCTTMIRGHEKIDRGFDVVYDLGDRLLLNLFSAGGHDNRDLPEGASYRSVTPMALTIHHGAGAPVAQPWAIDYRPFNHPPHNGLHRVAPLLEFRYG